jgi:signal transduction histidine kinase
MERVQHRVDLGPIFNSLPGCHLILLPDAPLFTIVAVTDAYLASTYCKREEIIGQGVFQSLTDNPQNPQASGVKNLSASLHQVIESKTAHGMADQRYDVYNPAKDQFEHRIWRPMNKPVLDQDGNVQYIIHTVEDITEALLVQEESQRATTKLGESEHLFRNMVEQAPIGILLSRGEEVVIESLNTPMLQHLNKTSFAEVLGKKMLEVRPELKGQPVLRKLINVQKTGIPYRGDHIPVDLLVDGKLERHYFHISFTPIIESGEIAGVLHVALDVTNQTLYQKHLEESETQLQQKVMDRTLALEGLNQELQRSNTNLEEFAYAASHDMKEPIRKIHFFADRLRARLEHKMEEEDRRYFDRLDAGAQRMSTLIDDLLLYSHVNRGVSAVEIVDLNQMLSFVLDDLELHMEEKGATVEIGLLPTVQGSETTVHSSTIHPDKMYHLIEVRDNGIGFEQADAERIFNVFTRLHGNAEYRGTGVGLSIVQKIVENHQGYIWAESSLGEGASFKILLPEDGMTASA